MLVIALWGLVFFVIGLFLPKKDGAWGIKDKLIGIALLTALGFCMGFIIAIINAPPPSFKLDSTTKTELALVIPTTNIYLIVDGERATGFDGKTPVYISSYEIKAVEKPSCLVEKYVVDLYDPKKWWHINLGPKIDPSFTFTKYRAVVSEKMILDISKK